MRYVQTILALHLESNNKVGIERSSYHTAATKTAILASARPRVVLIEIVFQTFVLTMHGGDQNGSDPSLGHTCILVNAYLTINGVEHIGKHLKKKAAKAADRRTERGELMRYFVRRLNIERIRDHLDTITMPRMGKILEGIPTKDLYYLKTVCEDSKNFSKRFWWELDPEKHFEENTS